MDVEKPVSIYYIVLLMTCFGDNNINNKQRFTLMFVLHKFVFYIIVTFKSILNVLFPSCLMCVLSVAGNGNAGGSAASDAGKLIRPV